MADNRPFSLARFALAGAVIAGFLFALALGASPDLHKSLHHDADDSQHECLVTVLHSGGFEGAPAAVCTVQSSPMMTLILLAQEAVVAQSFFLSCSVFEHGPPVLS